MNHSYLVQLVSLLNLLNVADMPCGLEQRVAVAILDR